MRLRHIEVFHAIVQAGSISGAAQILHISQPAVTKVLQHAELQLGLPLFERVKGKLLPTPEAQRLFVEVDKLNRDLIGIRRLAASLRAGESESLRVMARPALGASVLPAAMGAWAQALPNNHCRLATQHKREIGSAPLVGEDDLGLAVVDPFTTTAANRSRARVRPLQPSAPVSLVLLSAANAPLPQVGRRLVKPIADATRASLATP